MLLGGDVLFSFFCRTTSSSVFAIVNHHITKNQAIFTSVFTLDDRFSTNLFSGLQAVRNGCNTQDGPWSNKGVVCAVSPRPIDRCPQLTN